VKIGSKPVVRGVDVDLVPAVSIAEPWRTAEVDCQSEESPTEVEFYTRPFEGQVMTPDDDGIWYPTAGDVLAIHEDIVNEYPDTEGGVRNQEDIASAISFVRDGHFGERPSTVYEKAYHLLRLLTANHPFVDGNKRTALDTVATFYFFNGYDFQFDDRVRDILRDFATDASAVDQDDVIEYLQATTTAIDVDDVVDQWQDDLVETGLETFDELDDSDTA
jgi:death-on-curing protein